MISSEVANRYAAALFSLASTAEEHSIFLQSLKQLSEAFHQDKAVLEFLNSPLVRAEKKEEALQAALKNQNINVNVLNLVLLLAKKDRLSILSQISTAYEQKADQAAHIKRGTVRSASILNDKQKTDIQKIIETYTKNKVVLAYQEDVSLLGGLTAQVGSLTFDDSLFAHLKRIKEDLNRSH